MHRISLIHWHAAEAKARAAILQAAGFDVAFSPVDAGTLRELRKNPPDAIVIELTRLPMQGRDLALVFRHHRSTRQVPLVFVAGEAEKVARIKEHVPDAVYTTWSRIRSSLKRAIANPPAVTTVPRSIFEGYSI